jgi:hypothetical protein
MRVADAVHMTSPTEGSAMHTDLHRFLSRIAGVVVTPHRWSSLLRLDAAESARHGELAAVQADAPLRHMT